MVTTTSSTIPVPGDVVLVDWGLDSLEGEVLTVYSAGGAVRVTVKVAVLGPSGEALEFATVTLPLLAITPVRPPE